MTGNATLTYSATAGSSYIPNAKTSTTSCEDYEQEWIDTGKELLQEDQVADCTQGTWSATEWVDYDCIPKRENSFSYCRVIVSNLCLQIQLVRKSRKSETPRLPTAHHCTRITFHTKE